ncbi:LuxR C-terminal-related transcriptional regulator [Microvirga pudoricolor]|uniref:LuxR C-terminal-related transcriptional regulator n=1 Tax=Microvirga pudoricolor TaxID=2778729 RepID=UPI00194DC0AE|nr:response regulator transcription factor [Microvirga pudoricolor]MBM6595174.1 response regulator transcription factor [Microvirga pudoricolor]
MRKSNDPNSLLDVDSFTQDTYPRYSQSAPGLDMTLKSIKAPPVVATLLVEPNTLLREGLKRILSGTDYGVVASGTAIEDLPVARIAHAHPQLLILGVPCNHDTLAADLQSLKAERPGLKVAVLVETYDLDQVVAAFDAGADAYLAKTISHEILLKSLDLVMLGEMVFPSAILDLVRRQAAATVQEAPQAHPIQAVDGDGEAAPKQLSVRETVILRCLMQGDSNKLIARKFDIAEATVKVHVKAILRKIQAKNRTQAAIWAASHLQSSRSGAQG